MSDGSFRASIIISNRECNMNENARAAASVIDSGDSTAAMDTTGRAPKANTATQHTQRRAQTERPRPSRSAASESRRHNHTKAPIDIDNKKREDTRPRKGSAFRILLVLKYLQTHLACTSKLVT